MNEAAMHSYDLPATMSFIQRDWLCCNQIVFFDGPPGDRYATLIDSGYATRAQQTLALVRHALAAQALPIQRLRRIVNTHLHSDHCGGNATIARASGAEILVPVHEWTAVREWDEDRLTFRATGQHCDRFEAAGTIAPGQTLTLGGLDWKVLAAPGHDPHSMILHCADKRLLISADALWENGFGIIFPELAGDSGFQEQHEVLDLIDSLPVDLVLPGHGGLFIDVKPAIERARARLSALRADPRRNARNSLKALTKFLLLERQRIDAQTLIDQCAHSTILHQAGGQIGMTQAQAMRWAIDELLAQGQLARADNGDLINAEPA